MAQACGAGAASARVPDDVWECFVIETKPIDGKAFAAGLRERIAAEVAELRTRAGLTPGLAVVLVGEDPASQVYVRNKAAQTAEAGMASFEHKLPRTPPRPRFWPSSQNSMRIRR